MIMKRAAVSLGLLAATCAASSAGAAVAQLQSQGAQATATPGNAALSNYNRADILLLALDSKGAGIATLAPAGFTGDANSPISLPPGWALGAKLVPAGGCVLRPTALSNDGQGGYRLSVMTMATSGPCPWKLGEYHYQLTINAGGYQGGSLGTITID